MMGITIFLLIILLFQPWIKSSYIAANELDNIIDDRFLSIISAYNSTINEFLNRYIIPSRFLSGITNNPSLLHCDISNIQQFYEIMTNTHQELFQHPKYIFLWEKDRICKISWPNKSSNPIDLTSFYNNQITTQFFEAQNHKSGILNYSIYLPLSETDSHDFILYYIEQISNQINFVTINTTSELISPPAPKTYSIEYDINSNYSQIKSPSYTTEFTIEEVGLIALSPNINSTSGASNSLIGISIPIQFLEDEIQQISKEFKCKYVFMNLDGGVMIDDENGSLSPESINNITQFKSIQSFSGFWSHLNEATGNYANDIAKLEVEDTIYKIKELKIYFMNNELFKMIIAFPDYESSQKYVFHESVVFISCLVLLCLVVIIVLLLLRKNANNKLRKLAKIEPQEIKFRNLGMIPQYGGIGTGIQKLRNLQLRFPEKEIFNKKMDNVISNLAEQKKKLFSAKLIQKNPDDEFCSYLIEPKSTFSTTTPQTTDPLRNNLFNPTNNNQMHDDSYFIWTGMHASRIPRYEHLGSLSFDWNKFTSSPAKELMRLMISIIADENLIFKEFDPDSLIQFMQQITTKCCKDNVRTAHELVSLNYLLNTFFKNWITRRIDRFILYMATFLYSTDSSIAFDLIDDSEDFSQATEKVWFSSSSSTTNLAEDSMDIEFHNDESSHDVRKDELIHDDMELQNSDEEQEQETNKLKLKMKAFQDNKSVILRNIDFILHMLTYFIPTPIDKAPVVEYFTETLTEIMIDVQDSKQFELLGEFSCRIESEYFSVISDQNDRILFMKALIMLCHFCPYWSSVETMLKATERLNHSIFGTNDNENIPEFHYEHSSKIVAPWVSLFMNFSPLDQIVNNLKANINYWKNKMS